MVTNTGVIAWLQDLRIRMERNAVYQTKKVTCRRGGIKYTDWALSRTVTGLCLAAEICKGRRSIDSALSGQR